MKKNDVEKIIGVGLLYFLFKSRAGAAPATQIQQETLRETPVFASIPQIPVFKEVSNIGNAPALKIEVSSAGRLNMIQVEEFLVPADVYVLLQRRIATNPQWWGDIYCDSLAAYARAWRAYGTGDLGVVLA